MNKLKAFLSNKTVKTIYTWLIIIAVGTAVLLTQFMFPLHIGYSGISLTAYSGNDFALNIKAEYDKLASGEYKNSALLSDTAFDMTREDDFLRVGISFNFINVSMYRVDDIQFKIEDIEKYADAFVFKESNVAQINRFSYDTVTLHFVICTKGLTNDDIQQAINSVRLSYSFNRPQLFASGGTIELPQITVPFDSIVKK